MRRGVEMCGKDSLCAQALQAVACTLAPASCQCQATACMFALASCQHHICLMCAPCLAPGLRIQRQTNGGSTSQHV